MAQRGKQAIDNADVELVKVWGDCGRVTKRDVRSSIELCSMEKDITAYNLWEYVLKKNGWIGIVIKHGSNSSCAWSVDKRWAIKYKIDGDDYIFVRFT